MKPRIRISPSIVVRTIVAPEAVSRTMEKNMPATTLTVPKTGERRNVCLKEPLTCRLISAGENDHRRDEQHTHYGYRSYDDYPREDADARAHCY